jgi:hypothetical protein
MLGLGIFLMVVAGVVSLVGTIMFAVAAFRVSLLWGLLVLFVPFAGLVFLVKFWPQAKRGFLIGLAGSGLAVVAYLVLSVGIASTVKAPFGQLAAQAAAGKNQPQPATRPAVGEPAPATLPGVRAAEARPVAVRRALPELPLDPVDPGEVTPRDLPRHVGEELRFVEKAGGSVWGKLVSVKPGSLTIERRLHGGSVQYDLPLADIRQVRTPE